ncbi:MAG TPA: Rieske 2Fe-2S domain-containing protein [Rhodocyclaceae bacterium]|nr:Rieske 2Fe-2S domain-containing protein [Rhodocyclaceae bacterium]HNC53387.1 Rieske 2Fe-2S domain-containing protein [Accumulibacter sp.]HMV52635.1 Rieske 2Fe-2S domain-containing protein [Rhodocyclaceae bacterium]HMZ83969.1 Rieske 2Fe-2S domain-containing protein [Rhodocyclaceae bacterium]HNA03753.1 Rieske 2Fe-2S domain-containing protein [Rhodocyclaceae bacterium]
MAFRKVCTLDDLWEGEMASFDVEGHEVLLVWPEGGDVRAFQGVCPHQDIPLEEGKFDGKVIMCRAHQWTFDAGTGKGINPGDCRLAEYPIQISGNDILVETEGVTPLFAHS